MAADMRDFVRGLFQESPDLSVLTHAIVRKKYLVHTGQTSLTKEEKEQLKLLVEEELVQMKVDDSPGSEVIMTEVLASAKSGGHKRPLCVSSSSSDEVQSKQEQKKQRIRKKPDAGSNEDSGIDSKKVLVRDSKKRGEDSSETSDQEDLGTETHTDESESDRLSSGNKKRTSPWKARRERQKGSKTTKQNHARREDTSGSESDKDAEGQESDVLEVVGKHRKATKGQTDELESDSEWEFQGKKKGGKETKQTHAKKDDGTQDVRRRGKDDDSEEESKPSKEWEILRGKRVDSSGSEEEAEKKWDGLKRKGDKRGQRIGKAQEETESEDESGPDLEFKEKITNSKRKGESVRIEELESSSDGNWDGSQMKKGTPKGKTKGVSKKTWSHKSESDSEDMKPPKKEDIKKTQRKNGSGRRLKKEQEGGKPGIHKLKRAVTGEDSESETDEEEDSKQKNQGKQKACRFEGESSSETEEGGKGESNCRNVTLSSSESKSGLDEHESGDERRNVGLKKKKDVSESESSQEEEMLKKREEKSQRLSKKDSEHSGSKSVGRNKSLGQMKKEKPRKRVHSKDASGNESVKEAESSGSGDEDNPTSSKQQHQGKGEEHPSIRRLKRYIRECGVHRNYKKLFACSQSRRAQVEILKKELESLGLKGTPSLAKCKALKQKREEAAEVASLDINNIITTEGRPRRRNVWSLYSKPQDPPSSPEEPPTRRPATDWSRLRGVISSDEESS